MADSSDKTPETDGPKKSSRRKKKRGLGRGLKNLIPDRDDSNPRRLVQADIDDVVRPPTQPRKDFDEAGLQELADSIRENGLIQPLVVRQAGDRFELIAGERRLRASQLAGLEELPVVVKDVTDAEAYALALVENIQREDLNPIEEANAYRRLMDEFGNTQSQLAEQLGKSRSTIANAVRLLNLPASVQQMVADGDLSAGHARVLVPLGDNKARTLAKKIARRGLSVREAEKLVKSVQDQEDDSEETSSSGGSRYRDDAQVRQITDRLQRALGTKVKLKDKHGKGRVEIHYDDYEVLQSIIERVEEA
jgi:ParB family chromosome partitioning protein